MRTSWRMWGRTASHFRNVGVIVVPMRPAARYEADAAAPLYPDVAPTLQLLRSEGFSVAVLSDADTAYLAENIARNGVVVDAIVTSEELHCYKPHRSMFDEICRRVGVPAGDAVVVGDSAVNDVEGGLRAGLTAVWLNRQGAAWQLSSCRLHAEIATLKDLRSVLGIQ